MLKSDISAQIRAKESSLPSPIHHKSESIMPGTSPPITERSVTSVMSNPSGGTPGMGNNPSGGTPGMGNNSSGGTPGMGNNPSGGTPGMGGNPSGGTPGM